MANLEDLLQCAICLDRMKEPKMLQCQHTYCKACLVKMDGHGSITCPECRKVHCLNYEGVNGLPKNLTITKLLDVSTENKGTAKASFQDCRRKTTQAEPSSRQCDRMPSYWPEKQFEKPLSQDYKKKSIQAECPEHDARNLYDEVEREIARMGGMDGVTRDMICEEDAINFEREQNRRYNERLDRQRIARSRAVQHRHAMECIPGLVTNFNGMSLTRSMLSPPMHRSGMSECIVIGPSPPMLSGLCVHHPVPIRSRNMGMGEFGMYMGMIDEEVCFGGDMFPGF